jgi:hypothetical protein
MLLLDGVARAVGAACQIARWDVGRYDTMSNDGVAFSPAGMATRPATEGHLSPSPISIGLFANVEWQ